MDDIDRCVSVTCAHILGEKDPEHHTGPTGGQSEQPGAGEGRPWSPREEGEQVWPGGDGAHHAGGGRNRAGPLG